MDRVDHDRAGALAVAAERAEAAEPVEPAEAAGWPGGLDEVTVVSRAQDGDPDAFEALVSHYQAPLFRYATRMLRDRDAAEDVVQDTFVSAWRRLPTLQQAGAFRGWLYQIATRRALDVLRARRPEAALDPERETAPAAADPAVAAEERAGVEALRVALEALPVASRVVWSLRELDGLSYEEISQAVGLPPSTVRGRLARARAELSERMTSWR